jgi:hypothetical protein
MMVTGIIDRFRENPRDLVFVGLLGVCLLIAIGGINAELEKKEALLQQGGARKIDLPLVREQISDGHLSPKKALFQKKVPR